MLLGIPGIGVQRAQKLIQHFGSIKAVLNADISELRRIAGLSVDQAEYMKSIVEG